MKIWSTHSKVSKRHQDRVLKMCFGKDRVEGFILERPVVILFFLSSHNL